jgi:putative DNA primase/helicase
VPVFGPNGELQTEPGYHAASRTFYQRPNGFVLPPVSQHPPGDEIRRARRLLVDEMFGDFPCVHAPSRVPGTYPVGKSPHSAERAHAVALTLLPFVRALIDGPTPLHLVEAPSAGTGTSLLVEIALYPALGRTVKRTPAVPDEAAWRKKLASLLLEAPTAIFIDKIHDQLDSAALSSFLEGTVATDRIRGVAKMGTFENHAVWACTTGTNPTAHEEILRRAIRIRLDAERERPNERTAFRHKSLRSWVHEHRAELVWACLTLIRAWLSAGRPTGGERTDEHGFRFITPPALLAGFESWSRTMSGILEVAMVPGFLENREEWTPDRADPETDALQGFVEAWWRYFQEEPVRASQLFQLADHHLDLEGRTEHARTVALGKRLIALKDRKVGTCFIRKAEVDAHSKVNRWRLKPAMPGPRRT